MYALERPHPAHGPSLVAGTPASLLVALPAAWLAAQALGALGWLPRRAVDVIGLAAAHGVLLGVAVAWTTRSSRAQAWAPAAPLVVAGALAALGPPGLLGHALLPLWLVWLARDGRVDWLRSAPLLLILSGALLGAVLGAHMLVGTTLTLGYRIGAPDAALLPWLAYDVGANVPAGEGFFRGALFDRAHRRWSLGVATAISTGAYVARYLLDPLLPKTLELMAGAAFYLSLLGIANCWFFARSGSVLPGLAASLVFFAAYRLLAPA
ncbi:MAG: CPBP family glutamic-type intramembrane protease [Candidatus Rokuibacteriota bacterium]